MNDYESLLSTLAAACIDEDQVRPGDVERFERVVTALSETRDVRCIRPLLLRLDDASPFTGTMEHILLSLELLPARQVFEELFLNLEDYMCRSPEWVRNIIISSLNTPSQHAAFSDAATTTTAATKRELRDLLMEMQVEHQQAIYDALIARMSVYEFTK
jgi:hypothetical protein